MNEANYQDLLDFQRFDNLVNKELYVSVEDYKFIVAYDFSEKENFFFCGWNYKEGESYLNLNLYSEHEHDAKQLERETY